MSDVDPILRGRGAAENPPNRFELLVYERDPEVDPNDCPAPQTQFLHDRTRSIIARNDSPDVGFDASINPYRGCEHGCVYCYARPTHEYLGFSAGIDFETRILVKHDAPELLRQALSKKSWQPQPIAVSGNTDCYQPVERHLKLTRRCLEVLAEFRNPAIVITKSQLVARDVDVLAELAKHQAAEVFLSITTLDGELARRLEPRATQPSGRLAAIRALADAGVPVGTLVAPVIPGLNDHEIPTILEAAAEAGARFAGYVMLRLPHGIKELFHNWLERHYPERKDKVLSRIREVRSGNLSDPNFGSRMRGEGEIAEVIERLFKLAMKKHGYEGRGPKLFTAGFRVPGQQRMLFE
jgi:DNA repair photolyase